MVVFYADKETTLEKSSMNTVEAYSTNTAARGRAIRARFIRKPLNTRQRYNCLVAYCTWGRVESSRVAAV
jgi:hypothetical protein